MKAPGPAIQFLLCLNFYYDEYHAQVRERPSGRFRVNKRGMVQLDRRQYPADKVIHLLQTGMWPDE